VNNPNYELNKETYFPYSPNFFMNKDCNTSSGRSNSRSKERNLDYKEPKKFYQNYLNNSEELFNKEEFLEKQNKVRERSISNSKAKLLASMNKEEKTKKTTTGLLSKLGNK